MPIRHFTTRNVLSGFCLILPPLAVLSPNAVVPLLIVAALLAGLSTWRETGHLPRPDRTATLFLGLLLVWSAITATWSFDPSWALFSVVRLAVLFLSGLVLFEVCRSRGEDERQRLVKWLIAGFALGVSIFLFERAFDFPIHRLANLLEPDFNVPLFRLNRPAVAMTLMAWPLTAALLWLKGRPAALLPVCMFGIVLLSESDSALFGLAAGIVLSGISVMSRPLGRRILALAVIVGFLGAPFIATGLHAMGLDRPDTLDSELQQQVNSAQHRIYIWGFVADRIAEHPFQGWGFDSSRNMPNFGVQSFKQQPGQVMPLHPHNAVLQIWLELGLPGVLLAMGFVLCVIRRLDRLTPSAEICAQGFLASTLVIATSSYGIWQNMWVSVLFAAAALVPLSDLPGLLSDTSTAADRRE